MKKTTTTFSPLPSQDSKQESKDVLRQPYTNFDILSQPVSADMLIERWSFDRSEISNHIDENYLPNLFSEVFPDDRECKGCLGEGGLPYILRNSCIACQLLTRLFSPGEEGHTRTVTIQTGSNQGKNYYVSFISSSLDSLSPYNYTTNAKDYGGKILSKLNDMLICEKGFSSRIKDTKTYSTKSRLSNYITASCIIEAEMKAADMPGIPIFRWIYGCKNGSVMVEEDISERGTLNNITKYKSFMNSNRTRLKSDVARLVLSQVAMNLSFLSNYDFTHGKPSLESIVISNEPCSMKYDGIRLESPFTIHIVPSEYTNMTINVADNLIRTYCSANFVPEAADLRLISNFKFASHLRKSEGVTVCSPVKRTADKKINPTLRDFKSIRVMSYKLGEGDSYDIYTNNLGIALFPASFDIYAFFVSLMLVEQFYLAVIEDVELKKIWTHMWIEQEYNDVMIELHNLKKTNSTSYSSIRNMLSKFYLRCDGLMYVWESLKCLSSINQK
jgi:hypothetical protein